MSDENKINVKDLREKSVEELQTVLYDLRKEQFGLNMSRGAGQEVKAHLHKQVKRDIARVKTVLNEKK